MGKTRENPKQASSRARGGPAGGSAHGPGDDEGRVVTLSVKSVKTPGDRVRVIERAMNHLVPGFHEFLRRVYPKAKPGPNQRSLTAEESRKLLASLTDDETVAVAALEGPLHVHEFIGLFLDWAQAVAGLPTQPLASSVVVVVRENDQMEMHLDKLQDLGEFDLMHLMHLIVSS